MDASDVEMMIRAILASKKDPITLQELKREYIEANGEDVPFRQLGYASVVKYLESIPDKVNLRTDFSGITYISPVIDKQIQHLSMLVKGQKRVKRKKSKPSSSNRFRPPSNRFQSGPSRRPFFNNNNNNNNNNNYQTMNYNNRDDRPRSFQESFFKSAPPPPPPPNSMPRMGSSNPRQARSVVCAKFGAIQRTVHQVLNLKPAGLEMRKEVETLGAEVTIPLADDDYWINNAAYFLRDHEVLVLHVLDIDEVCLRLKNCDFSKQYDKLLEKMNSYYAQNSKRCLTLAVNQICVAKYGNDFYRVQVIEVSETSAYCCFVDEGAHDEVSKENLYPIQKEFLDLKFQTILAQLQDFEQFNKNSFLKENLLQLLNQKSVIAKRTESKPLKVKLYELNGTICITDQILIDCAHFKVPKLIPKSEFYAYISYFDDRKKLTYIQIDEEVRKFKLEEMIILFGEHFNSPTTPRGPLVKFDEIKKDKIFCVKYSKDNNWYRVRILRTPEAGEKSVLIDFVDFGNEESVPIDTLREIPAKFVEQKHMPFQTIGVIVTEIKNTTRTIIDFLDCLNPVLFTVSSVNNNSIPYVTLTANDDTRTTDTESTDVGEEDEEDEEAKNGKQEHDGEEENENDRTIVESATLTSINTIVAVEPKHAIEDKVIQGSNFSIEQETESIINKLDSLSYLKKINYGIIEKLHVSQLLKANLPATTYVYVMRSNDASDIEPSNFKICLHEHKELYDEMLRDMEDFYNHKNINIVPESNLLKDHIYIYKTTQPKVQYNRVRFLEFLSPFPGMIMAKLYNVDTGSYDLCSTDCIYYISKRFTKLPMMALDAKLAYVKSDLANDKWSEKTKRYFNSLVTAHDRFRTSLVRYEVDTDQWIIELYDKSVSISKLLLAGDYAKSAC